MAPIRVIPQDGAGRRNQEEERKKYHNKQAEAIHNVYRHERRAALLSWYRAIFS